MTLSKELLPRIFAGFSGLWIQTAEAEEAVHEIRTLCAQYQWSCWEWDLDRGLLDPEQKPQPNTQTPLVPLKRVQEQEKPQLVCLHNYHRFLQDPMVVQALTNAILHGKSEQVFYLVLSPLTQIPLELEKLFTVLEHPLPDREKLLQKLADLDGIREVHEQAVFAAQGLTSREAENAYSLSLVKKEGVIHPDIIWEVKTQAVKKKGFLELYRGKENFSQLGGLQGLKDFSRKLLRPDSPVTPRGLLLLGPPGTGKSAFCKALGSETNRPTLLMDVGRLHSKYVGESEASMREALRLADSLAPCLLFVDEVEKALSGAGSEGDSGVSSRLFGTFLSWMNDHTSNVFLVCTANDVSKLPPEFSRAERFDRTFFIDLPDQEERNRIWQIYLQQYQFSTKTTLLPPQDEGWTGAEIKSCCRLARALGVSLAEASRGLIPVSLSSQDKIRSLREWARGKVTDAGTGDIYMGEEAKAIQRGRRKVQTEIGKEGGL